LEKPPGVVLIDFKQGLGYGFRYPACMVDNLNVKAILMNDRVETLFSPEKLGKRWQRPAEPKPSDSADLPGQVTAKGLEEAFTTVSKAVVNVVKGERRKKVVAAMLGELQDGMAAVCRGDGKSPVQDEEVLAMIMKIQKLEDMLEAYLGAQGDLRQ